MQASALVRIVPNGHPRRPAIRALLDTARRVQCMSGFLRWQTFRSMDASGAILVLVDWDSAERLRFAIQAQALRDACAGLEAHGMRVAPAQVVTTAYDRQLATHDPVATLLRVSAGASHSFADRDSDFALRAMAAPGSTRLCGGRTDDDGSAICRIDFDTEDGIWHFLESPLRRAWTRWAEKGQEQEVWAINLPRLEFRRLEPLAFLPPEPAAPSNQLSVQLSVDEATQVAQIRFQGRIDRQGCSRCEKLCHVLIADGCRVLEVDVSGLAGISQQALAMLTRTARTVREGGGRFVLIDNAERVKRVTRSKHLESCLR